MLVFLTSWGLLFANRCFKFSRTSPSSLDVSSSSSLSSSSLPSSSLPSSSEPEPLFSSGI